MTNQDKEQLIAVESAEKLPQKIVKYVIRRKLPSSWGIGFVLFWVLLFYAVVIPLFYRLPTPVTTDNGKRGVFVAERAYETLQGLAAIGTKVVGSKGNEIDTVQYLLNKLAQIEKDELLNDCYDFELDLQTVSGSYILDTMVNQYQAVQNIVFKLSPKNTTSTTYLLVNSHFDSKPTSPSVGDAGHMISSLLEVFRVIATTRQGIIHPIVFLFNGAEENPLQASHGFITQHKWAKYIKAVVNTDAAGSGGREILFQSGPKNSWLIDLYSKNIEHPFATTMAEEIFQSGIIPSDTDFSIFKKYGNLIGYDIAQCINGFVYHTKNDRIDVIPVAALQNTGDNLLNLVRALANATELYEVESSESGYAIFFDFLGIYFVHYLASNGEILNYSVSAAIIILIFVAIWRISEISELDLIDLLIWSLLILIVQLIGFVLGIALPVVVAYIFDKYGLSLSYFSNPLLLIGLYVSPSLLGLLLPITIFLKLQNNNKISFAYQLQLALHGQALILAILGIGITVYGLRSAYVITWTLIFYLLPLGLNLLLTTQDRGYSWITLLKILQIPSFLYNSYLFYTFVTVLIPMMGRFGTTTNPDLYISALTALGTVLALGFLILLVNALRRPGLIILGLLVVSGLTIYLASSTEIGFPYREKTNVQRVPYLQVRRVFYEYDGTVSKDESGYLFNFQDRRTYAPLVTANVNLKGLVNITNDCSTKMFCGMPFYDYHWVNARASAMWLPRETPIELPDVPQLNLLGKSVDGTVARYEFNVSGSNHMSVLVQPYEDVVLSNWTFLESYLEQSSTSYPPPYHVYWSCGIDCSPLNFVLEFTKSNGDFDVPVFQLGIGGHYIESAGDDESVAFANSFPPSAALVQWPASYQRRIY